MDRVRSGLTQQQPEDITAARKSEVSYRTIGSQKELGDWLGLVLVLLLLLLFPLFPLLVGLWVWLGRSMFGGDQGAEIGGNMAEDLNKNC